MDPWLCVTDFGQDCLSQNYYEVSKKRVNSGKYLRLTDPGSAHAAHRSVQLTFQRVIVNRMRRYRAFGGYVGCVSAMLFRKGQNICSID